MFRESIFAEVEFRSKPDVDECLGHLRLPSLSLVPEFRDHLGYIEEEREVSRINMSAVILAFD